MRLKQNNLDYSYLSTSKMKLFFFNNREIILVTLLAFFLRFTALLILNDWIDDGYTWILYSKSIHTDVFFRTPRNFVFLPLFAYIGALFILLTDLLEIELLKSLQILNAILGTISVIMTYFVAKKVTNNLLIPIISAFLVAVNPVHILFSISSINEISFSVFLLLTIYFFIEKDQHRYGLFLSGFFFTLACMTRYEGWSLIPFLIPFFYIKRAEINGRWLQILSNISLGILGISLWFLREWLVFDKPFLPLEHYFGGHGSSGRMFYANNLILDFLYFPATLVAITLIIALFSIFILPFFIISDKNIRNSSFDTLYLAFLGFLGILSVSFALGGNSGWDRYLVPIIPMAMILGVISITKLLELLYARFNYYFPTLLKQKTLFISFIWSVLLIFYMITGALILFIYAPDFNFYRHDEAIDAGKYLKHNYTGGNIICDLPSIIIASELPIEFFFDSINFFANNKYDNYKELFLSNNISYVIWTNAEYSHLEENLPYINETTPFQVTYEGIYYSLIYRSERVPKHAYIDIYKVKVL